jgi:hypothetical protein
MNRRDFLTAATTAAAMVYDPEFLLWKPGRKTWFIPPPPPRHPPMWVPSTEAGIDYYLPENERRPTDEEFRDMLMRWHAAVDPPDSDADTRMSAITRKAIATLDSLNL